MLEQVVYEIWVSLSVLEKEAEFRTVSSARSNWRRIFGITPKERKLMSGA